MKAAIDAVPYASAVKVGLQFKRRFWEEDEVINGGISYTDLPIRQIAYPNTGYNRSGRGVLLGAYIIEGSNSYEFTSMPPAERVARAVALGSRIHPQYGDEFENGIAWLGIACRSRSDVPATGLKKRGQSITTACAKSMAGSSWRASTRHTFQHGKRVLSSHRSTHLAAARSCRQNVK